MGYTAVCRDLIVEGRGSDVGSVVVGSELPANRLASVKNAA